MNRYLRYAWKPYKNDNCNTDDDDDGDDDDGDDDDDDDGNNDDDDGNNDDDHGNNDDDNDLIVFWLVFSYPIFSHIALLKVYSFLPYHLIMI